MNAYTIYQAAPGSSVGQVRNEGELPNSDETAVTSDNNQFIIRIRVDRLERSKITCPGCIMQLQDIINHGNLKLKAVHIFELLAQSLDQQIE